MAVLSRFIGWAKLPLRIFQRRAGARKVNLKKLSRILNYSMKSTDLFVEALSHRSYLQIPGTDSAVSNERLEFLGDAVLNLAVAEYLYLQNEMAQEGELTKIRARLVNRKALTIYAREMQLSDFIRMSPGISHVAAKGLDTILANAYEAIVGAIYLDGGYQEAKQFVSRTINDALARGTLKIADENFKSKLLEYAQAEGIGTPRYVTINEEGPDHDRTFTVEVYIGSSSYGIGLGKNKKDAEQLAAERALQRLGVQ